MPSVNFGDWIPTLVMVSPVGTELVPIVEGTSTRYALASDFMGGGGAAVYDWSGNPLFDTANGLLWDSGAQLIDGGGNLYDSGGNVLRDISGTTYLPYGVTDNSSSLGTAGQSLVTDGAIVQWSDPIIPFANVHWLNGLPFGDGSNDVLLNNLGGSIADSNTLYYPTGPPLADSSGVVWYFTGQSFIQPGGDVYLIYGVADSMSTLGTAGQLLSTTGSGVLWTYALTDSSLSTGAAYDSPIADGTGAWYWGPAPQPYTPATSGDWSGDPTTVAEALDRIAAVVSVGGLTPIP